MSFYSYCMKHGKELLLGQWDAENNMPITPEGIACTSTDRVWWKCEKGHFWQTQLASRAKGNTGCPICLREKIDTRMEKRRLAAAEKKKSAIKIQNRGEEL